MFRKCDEFQFEMNELTYDLSFQNNLLMLAILAFEVTIYRHQEYFRLRNKLSPPAARIIFHDITRQHLDIGIISFIKYFINYFFYKFGLEVRETLNDPLLALHTVTACIWYSIYLYRSVYSVY